MGWWCFFKKKKKCGGLFFSVAQWKSELEMRRKDSLQNKFDTSVKKRSIFSKALRQGPKLTDFIIGDKSRYVFSTKNHTLATDSEFPSIRYTQRSLNSFGLHPSCCEEKMLWVLSASPVCSHNVGSALRGFTAVL